MRVGQHTLATWSSTLKVVSLSNAESEYRNMVRCASEAIGLANTVRELGHAAHVRIWTDVTAARRLALRSGSGTIKHMETKYSWMQQKEKNQDLRIEKIRGTVNPADLMTKHRDGKRLVMLTLEEGRCAQDVSARIMMITKHGKAAHCRNDCPFLLKSHVIQSLSWCSHCDPNDALEKRAWRRRVG